METTPGGENTPYESTNTFTKPHSKQGGQLSDPSTDIPADAPSGPTAERAAKTAENIRYGQAMSEQGMGGKTAPSANSGEGNVDGGFGGTVSQEGAGAVDAADERRAQGYGGEKDMDREVGA